MKHSGTAESDNGNKRVYDSNSNNIVDNDWWE